MNLFTICLQFCFHKTRQSLSSFFVFPFNPTHRIDEIEGCILPIHVLEFKFSTDPLLSFPFCHQTNIVYLSIANCCIPLVSILLLIRKLLHFCRIFKTSFTEHQPRKSVFLMSVGNNNFFVSDLFLSFSFLIK